MLTKNAVVSAIKLFRVISLLKPRVFTAVANSGAGLLIPGPKLAYQRQTTWTACIRHVIIS